MARPPLCPWDADAAGTLPAVVAAAAVARDILSADDGTADCSKSASLLLYLLA